MDFDRAQQALEVLQTQCPKTDTQEIGAWISAITRAREVLFELQIMEDRAEPVRSAMAPDGPPRVAWRSQCDDADRSRPAPA